jgi:hypothetical protein
MPPPRPLPPAAAGRSGCEGSGTACQPANLRGEKQAFPNRHRNGLQRRLVRDPDPAG